MVDTLLRYNIQNDWSRFSFPIFPDFSTRKYFSVLIVLQTRSLYVKCFNLTFFIQSVTISVPIHSLLCPKKLSCHEEENGRGHKKMTHLTDDRVEIPAFIKRDRERIHIAGVRVNMMTMITPSKVDGG